MSSSRAASDADRFDFFLVAVPDPGIGHDWEYTVPANNLLELVTCRFYLFTALFGVTRYPNLGFVDDSSKLYFAVPCGVGHRADTTLRYNYGLTQGYYNLIQSAGEVIFGLPLDNRLAPGFKVQMNTYGLAGGDRYGDIFLRFKRWIIA